MQSSTPQISIIVPVYKAEHCLHECINSILKQTFTDFELLLIDDGSPDNSGAVCDKYAQQDKRIKVFHTKNRGVSSARNLGLDKAGGQWITFCDSDDWIEKDWLESYINEINKRHYDIIFQGYICDSPKTSKKYFTKNLPSEYTKTIFELEKKDLFGWTWNKLFKAHIIQKNNLRFNNTLNINEDLLFTLQYCLHAHSILVLPIAKYHYIIHQESLMTRKYPYKELQNKNELIKEARQQLANKDQNNIEYNEWIYERYCGDMISCLKRLYLNRPLPILHERLKMLKLIDGLKHQISKYSTKDKLLLIILKILPYSITDFILRNISLI